MKMDKQLKKEWIAALLSGEYEQGDGALCKDGRYCCLGVLYDLTDAYWLPPRRIRGTRVMSGWRTEADDQGSFGAELFGQVIADSLASDNDDGLTFAQLAVEIADVVETNP